MSANAPLKEARKALDAKDWASALKYAQQALELDKKNYNAFVFSGLAQYNLGQAQKAEQAYLQGTQLEPKNIVAWQGLADLYSKTNNKPKLLETYERILEVMGPGHAKYRATLQKVLAVCLEHQSWSQAQNHVLALLQLLEQDTSETGVKERSAALTQLLAVRQQSQHEEVLRLLLIWARQEFTGVEDTVLIAQVTGVMAAPARETRDRPSETGVKQEIDVGEENRRVRSEQIRAAIAERRYEFVNDILTRDYVQTDQLFNTLLSLSHDSDYLTVLDKYIVFLMRQLQLTALTPVKAAPLLKQVLSHLKTLIDKHPLRSALPYLYYLTLFERDDAPITWSDVMRVTQRLVKFHPVVPELAEETFFGVPLVPPTSLGWIYLASLYLFIATPVSELTCEQVTRVTLPATYRTEQLHKAMSILTRHYEQPRDTVDSLMGLFGLAKLNLDSKNYVRAIEVAKRGLEVIKRRASHQSPLHGRFWVQYHVILAEAALARSELTAVKQIWSSVLKFDAQNIAALKGMAHLSYLTRDHSAATQLYTQLSALVDDTDADYHVIRTRLAWCRVLPVILREQHHYLNHVLNTPTTQLAQPRMPTDEEISAKTLTKEDMFELMNAKTALQRAIDHVMLVRDKEHVTMRHRHREDEEAIEYHVTLARLLFWMGGDNRKQCHQLLLTALDISLTTHASFLFQHVSLAWCLLGEWYHTIGAIVPKHRALAVEAWLRAIRVLLANSRLVHYHHGGDPMTRDDTLLALVSPLAGTRLLSAWLHDPARDLQHSIQLLNELSHAVNATWTLLPLGLLYLRAADYSNAVANFQKYLRQQPRHLKAWLSLAECYRRQGKLTAALRVAERAKELSSESRDQHYAHWTATIIGNIRLRLGQISEARDEYSKCLAPSHVAGHVLQDAYQQLAIHGVASSSLLLMRKLFKEGRFRQARDQLNLAEEILTKAHVLGQAHLVSVWKLLGDIYTQHYLFRHHHSELSRDSVAEHYRSVKDKLVAGTKAYLHAIQLEKDRADLYSDLAVNCYFQAVFALELADHVAAEQSLTQAEQHIKTAINLAQQSPHLSRDKLARYWTSLGCVLAQLFRTREHKSRDHTLLNKAQHAFIVAARFSERQVAALRNVALIAARTLLRGAKNSAVTVTLTEAVLRDALRVDPTDAATWTTLAVILSQLSTEHADQVLPYLVNAHDLDPNQSLAVQLMTHVTYQRHAPLTPKIRLAAVQYLDRHVTDVTALNQLALLFLDLACSTDRSATALASLNSAVRYFRTAVAAAEIKSYSAHHQTVLKLNLARTLTQLAHRAHSPSVNDEALAIYSTLDGTSIDVKLNIALARVTAGDFSAAVTLLGQARALLPNMASLIDTLSIKLRYGIAKKGKKSDLDELKKHVTTVHKETSAIFGAVIAILTEDTKMFSECVSKCQQVSLDDPLHASVDLLHSHWHAAQNDAVKAVKALIRAVHKSPDDMVLWGHLRRLILNKAMADLQPTLALEVSNRIALFRAVNSQKRTARDGLGTDVVTDLQEALKIDAVALLMSGREKKHARQAALTRAQSYARKILHQDPCDSIGWFLLAACHYSAALLNDHVTAQTLAQLNTLFDTCQHHHLAEHYVTCFSLMLSHLHLHLAVTSDEHVTHRDTALTLLTRVSQVTLGGKLQSDMCRQLSVAQALHGQDKQSKSSLLTALRTDPHNRATWLHLAAHYIAQGQSAAAHECFTRARGLFRTRTSDYVAVTLKQIEWQYRTEQYLRALKACEELLQHCSAHQHAAPPVLHVILALTAANLNHKSKIQPALTRAVSADPSVAQWPIVALLQQFAT